MGGVTSARPQVWHPERLKKRDQSISGNPQSFVVFHKGKLRKGKWELIKMGMDEVVSLPEEKLALKVPSLTMLSRTCVSRVTSKVRGMMERGRNQRKVQGSIGGYSKLEWAMFLDLTVPDKDIKKLFWMVHESVGEGTCYIDGGLCHVSKTIPMEKQTVVYDSSSKLREVELADCDFSLCTPARGVTFGNTAILKLERGHNLRQWNKLEVTFICKIGESLGKILLKATYKEVVFEAQKVRDFLRLPPLPPPPPPRAV